MNLILIFLGTMIIITSSTEVCDYKDCPCSDDTTCKYYCKDNKCQDNIEYGLKCMGHTIHPRECGDRYCEPFNQTCQDFKTNGISCTYDWSCASEYCNQKSWKCQKKRIPRDRTTTLVAGSISGAFAIIFIIGLILLYLKDRRKNAKPQTAGVVVTPTNGIYTVENV